MRPQCAKMTPMVQHHLALARITRECGIVAVATRSSASFAPKSSASEAVRSIGGAITIDRREQNRRGLTVEKLRHSIGPAHQLEQRHQLCDTSQVIAPQQQKSPSPARAALAASPTEVVAPDPRRVFGCYAERLQRCLQHFAEIAITPPSRTGSKPQASIAPHHCRLWSAIRHHIGLSGRGAYAAPHRRQHANRAAYRRMDRGNLERMT